MNKLKVKILSTLILVVISGVIISITYIVLSLIQNTQESKTVESYCSIKYQNDVQQYKKCKKLNAIQLINSLKEETKKKNEIPVIEPII